MSVFLLPRVLWTWLTEKSKSQQVSLCAVPVPTIPFWNLESGHPGPSFSSTFELENKREQSKESFSNVLLHKTVSRPWIRHQIETSSSALFNIYIFLNRHFFLARFSLLDRCIVLCNGNKACQWCPVLFI